MGIEDERTVQLSGRVGRALTWKAVQLGAERLISLARFLILARLLAPGDFGLLAIATVALELLLTVTNFGMVTALVQRRDAEPRMYHAAWTVQVVRGAGIAAVVALAAPLIARLFGDADATNVMRLIAVRPLLTGLRSMRTADLERDLRFRELAAIDIPGQVVNTVVAVALVPAIGVYSLVAGMLAGDALRAVMSYRLAPYRPRLTLAREAAAPLFRYGRWILATGLVSVAGEAALRAIIGRGLGTGELGLYYLAGRLISIPNGVISVILAAVVFPLHARLQDEAESAARAFRANITALLATLVPIYFGIMALAPALIRDVLGSQWNGATGAITVLAVAPVLAILKDSVDPLMGGRGRPQSVTLLLVVRSGTLLVIAWPLSALLGLVGAAAAVVIAEVPTQILAARLARRELPTPFGGLRPAVLASLVASLGAAAVALGVDTLLGPPVGFFAAVGAAIAVGVPLMAILDRLTGAALFAQLIRAFPPLGRVRLLRQLAGCALSG